MTDLIPLEFLQPSKEPTKIVCCPTPCCRERFGDNPADHTFMNYNRYGFLPGRPDLHALCDHCGGHTDGVVSVHDCRDCGKSVAPGELVGLFIPSRCKECQQLAVDKQRASGDICGICQSPRLECCC